MDNFDALNDVDAKVRSGEISDNDWGENGRAVLISALFCLNQNNEQQIEFRLCKENSPKSQRSWWVSVPQKDWKEYRKLVTVRQLYGCLLAPLGKLEDDTIPLGTAMKELQEVLKTSSIVVDYSTMASDGVNPHNGKPYPAKLVRLDRVGIVPAIAIHRPEKKNNGDAAIDANTARVLGANNGYGGDDVPF